MYVIASVNAAPFASGELASYFEKLNAVVDAALPDMTYPTIAVSFPATVKELVDAAVNGIPATFMAPAAVPMLDIVILAVAVTSLPIFVYVPDAV